MIIGLFAFIFIRQTAPASSDHPSDLPPVSSGGEETPSAGSETGSDATESSGTETPSGGEETPSGGEEPSDPAEDDPLAQIVSNGITLRAFVDRLVEIALNEPSHPVVDGKTKYGELFGALKAA